MPTPLHKRTCPYCPGEVVDDEFHFILKCTVNNDIRNELLSKLPSHINSLSDEDLFKYLLSNAYETHIRAFGIFLFNSFELRLPPDNGLISSKHIISIDNSS